MDGGALRCVTDVIRCIYFAYNNIRSVIRKAYIICEADIIASAISPVRAKERISLKKIPVYDIINSPINKNLTKDRGSIRKMLISSINTAKENTK